MCFYLVDNDLISTRSRWCSRWSCKRIRSYSFVSFGMTLCQNKTSWAMLSQVESCRICHFRYTQNFVECLVLQLQGISFASFLPQKAFGTLSNHIMPITSLVVLGFCHFLCCCCVIAPPKFWYPPKVFGQLFFCILPLVCIIDCRLIFYLITLTKAMSFFSIIPTDNPANMSTTLILMPLASCAKGMIGLQWLGQHAFYLLWSVFVVKFLHIIILCLAREC